MATFSESNPGDGRAASARYFGLRPAPRRALEFLIFVAASAVVVYGLLHVTVVVLPVFFGLLLTALLRPPFRLLRRAKLPGPLASLLIVIGFLTLVAGIFAVVIPQFADQAGQLSSTLSKGVDRVSEALQDLPFGIAEDDVQQALERARDALRDNLGSIGQGLLQGVVTAGGVLTRAVLALVVTFFFVYDGERMWNWFVGLVPRRRREEIGELGPVLWHTLEKYLRGLVIVALVDAVFIGLGALIIGLPLALPIAVLTFLGAFVPIVGATLAGALAVLVGLVTGGLSDALLMLGVVLVVQQLEGNVLQPLIVGRTLALHPLVTLLAVAAGGSLAGVLGALFAVPVVAVVWQVMSFYRRRTGEGQQTEAAPA